jgi:[acyl-carrier-protein] S-malonyltransferase
MLSGKTTLLFPGQGAHNASMLDKYVSLPDFSRHYSVVVECLGFSPIEAIKADPSIVNSNSVSSLLTVLVSKLAHREYKKSGAATPSYYSGYSVGQFSALHAAGCFGFAELVQLVAKRAKLMDDCFSEISGSMMAIAGVVQSNVEELCTTLVNDGHQIWISNYNCNGQYSLAGTKSAIHQALERAKAHKPKRLLELPVGGAWHSPLLAPGEAQFKSLLETVTWNLPEVPVVDNVTGGLMPEDLSQMKQQLVLHLSHPVMWDKGIKTLVGLGCNNFIEIGYGNVLTKFGFFIDRNSEFQTFSGEVQPLGVE